MDNGRRSQRRWKREEFAAMLGTPSHIDAVTCAAIMNITTTEVRRLINNRLLGGYIIKRVCMVDVRQLIFPEAATGPGRAKMLRGGDLVERPVFRREQIERWIDKTEMTADEVATLTGQTTAEVRLDVRAGRLISLPSDDSSIAPHQFLEDYDGGARWMR